MTLQRKFMQTHRLRLISVYRSFCSFFSHQLLNARLYKWIWKSHENYESKQVRLLGNTPAYMIIFQRQSEICFEKGWAFVRLSGYWDMNPHVTIVLLCNNGEIIFPCCASVSLLNMGIITVPIAQYYCEA